MGYFDGLTDGAFKKSDQDKMLFYPWGVFGSGVILESNEQHEQFRDLLKKFTIIVVLATIAIQFAVGAWLNLLLVPVYLLWYFRKIKGLTANLPRTSEKLKVSESYKNSARSHNLPTLILLEILAVLFVVGSLLLPDQNLIVTILSLGFFGFCAIVIGYMIVAKLTLQDQK